MKIRITSIAKSFVTKLLYNTPSAKLERKIDTFLVVLNRNKLVASASNSIDEVVAFSKTKGIKHHIYY